MKKTRKRDYQSGYSSEKCAQNIEELQWRKYGTMQGHGFAAEDANAQYDILRGKKVVKTGVSNEANGADRIVNGVKIQTKYCQTPYGTVNAAFDPQTGIYRYSGQKLEVPKDQFDECVKYMAEKISSGKVPGVTNPAMAKNIIQRGSITYKQALNIAKAGTFDSIMFDVRNNVVTSVAAGGFSFVATYLREINAGKSQKEAVQKAMEDSIKTCGITTVAGVVAQQVLRTKSGPIVINAASNTIRNTAIKVASTQVGQKVAATSIGKAVLGQVFKKSAGTNVITGAAMALAEAIPDTVKLCRGKLKGSEFVEKRVVSTAGIGGGMAGMAVGAAVGSVIPGAGTIVGGAIGLVASIGSSAASSKAALKICGLFHRK